MISKLSKHDKEIIKLIDSFVLLGYDVTKDKNGQIIIYTGMKFNENDEIVPIEEDDN